MTSYTYWNYFVPVLEGVAFVVMVMSSLFAALPAFQRARGRNASVSYTLVDKFSASHALGMHLDGLPVSSDRYGGTFLRIVLRPFYGLIRASLAIIRIIGVFSRVPFSFEFVSAFFAIVAMSIPISIGHRKIEQDLFCLTAVACFVGIHCLRVSILNGNTSILRN